jgi:hypothetical protein
MTLASTVIVQKTDGYLYDGTNGPEVVAIIGSASLTYTAPNLVLNYGFGPIIVAPNTYITWPGAPTLAIATDYVVYPPPASTPDIAMGIATVPTIAGNTTINVDVTIKPTLPNTSYTCSAVLTGSVSLLSTLSLLSTTMLNVSTVRCSVRNTGLVSLGGAFLIATAVAP